MLIKHVNYSLMYPAGDDGSDAGGEVDRGDVIDAAAVEVEADEQPRDDEGKFAKEAEPEVVAEVKPRKDAHVMIPKARFDEQVQKERGRAEAAENRARELEAQIRQVSRNENVQQLDAAIEEMEDMLESARLDGDKDKSKALARELRLMERQVSINESNRMSETAKDQAREEMRLDLTIEKLEALHPMLAEGDEAYDQDIVDLVLATQRDLIQRERMTPSKALEAATKKVMMKVHPANSDGVVPEKSGLKEAKTVDGRKEAQVKKNIATAGKQPASLKEAGMDSDRAGQTKELPNVSSMTYEEFAALPASTKSKMRGDML